MKKRFKIAGPLDTLDNTLLYWSNDDGWSCFEGATIFTQNELEWINMPLESVGIVWLDDDGKVCEVEKLAIPNFS